MVGVYFPHMTVEFDEAVASVSRPTPRPSFITGLIMKTGLVKTPAAAQTVMLILTVILIVLAIALYRGASYEAPLPTAADTAL